MSILVYRADNNRRPPDWRWQRASELAEVANPSFVAGRDDSVIQKIMSFRRLLDRCETEDQRLEALDADPVLWTAHQIYDANDTPTESRWELEARLLARQSFEEIGDRMHEDPAVIECYEQIFFDVLSRINHPSVITHVVMGKAVQTGLAERSYDCLWKLFGYWCGPLVLDAYIYRLNSPIQPESARGLGACCDDLIMDTMKLKAAVTAVTYPINGYTAEGIMNIYQNMLTQERQSDGVGGGGTAVYAESISAMQEAFIWMKYRDGVDAPPPGLAPTYEKTGVRLRSQELAMLAMGVKPAALEHLTTISFPTGDDNNDQNAEAHPRE